MLKKIKVDKGDVLYMDGEFSEEMYFIKQGKVKIFSSSGFPYLTCKEGEHFGDEEILFRENRIGKAVAQIDCLLYTLGREDLEVLLDLYKEMKTELIT